MRILILSHEAEVEYEGLADNGGAEDPGSLRRQEGFAESLLHVEADSGSHQENAH
jgi:hypothetical protein